MSTVPTSVHRDHPFHRLYILYFVLLAAVLALVVALLIRHDWLVAPTTSTRLHGSGVAATQARELTPFTRIELAGANNVHVRVGAAQAVAVHADDNLIDRVTTAVRDGTLVIANRGTFTTTVPVSVDVTVPTLDNFVLSGSGTVDADGVQAQQFTIRVGGAGTVTVSGTVDRLDATLAGTGDVRLGDLVARDVRATASGTGRLEVHATDALDASVSGVGTIVYRGNPGTVIRNVTGTGSITES